MPQNVLQNGALDGWQSEKEDADMSKDERAISHELASRLVTYDPRTGHFTWLVNRKGGARAGTIAGGVAGNGYLLIGLHGGRYYAHRLAWLFTHGVWPASGIDHINGIKTDNRIANLRPANQAQNNLNRAIQSNNKSGFKGVSRDNSTKWRAVIMVAGKYMYLGAFDTPEQAHAAYREAAEMYGGGFGRA